MKTLFRTLFAALARRPGAERKEGAESAPCFVAMRPSAESAERRFGPLESAPLFNACLPAGVRVRAARRLAGAALAAACLAAPWPGHAQADATASLSVAEGVIVKFGAGAGLRVRGQLSTAAGVTLTSQADDQAGGQTGAAPGQPQPGDWLGIAVAPEAKPGRLMLDGLSVRYAGGVAGQGVSGEGGAALSLPGGAWRFERLDLQHSGVGLRVTGEGSPVITQSRLENNAIGLLAQNGATPVISGSSIAGNSRYGVQNLMPAAIVNARGNWWGHISGPREATSNPQGQGNAVSAGVDWGQHLAAPPMLDCTATPVGGYLTRQRAIELRLVCPQAAHYRIAEQSDFAGAAWQSMTGTPTTARHTLTPEPGDKRLYVQFRAADGSLAAVALPRAVTYAPTGWAVQFEQPAEGAVLTADTLIAVSVSDAQAAREIELLADGQRLALLAAVPHQTTYQATWPLAGVRNGLHTLTARATSAAGKVVTASRQVTVQRSGGPAGKGPALSLTFAGQSLQAGSVITQPGMLTIHAESDAGVAQIQGLIDGVAAFSRTWANTQSVTLSQFLDFAQLANGSHTLEVQASDGQGGQSSQSVNFTLQMSAPPAPVITAPADGASVAAPQISVTGTAAPGSRVQVRVDGQPAGAPITTGLSGSFAATVPLAEGTHSLTAVAGNAQGNSAESRAVRVSRTVSAPSLMFISPAENAALNAALSAEAEVAVSALDASGIAKVDLYADGKLLVSRTQAPWSARWKLKGVSDGAHVLRAVATSAAGKTAEAQRTVTVQRTDAPAPIQLPYAVRGISASPAESFGSTPIRIRGEAISSGGGNGASGQPVPGAPLLMILRVQGFERRIHLLSDSAGRIDYEFVPQTSDAGVYEVRVIHPQDAAWASRAPQARFAINRLSVDWEQYKLNAVRGVAGTATLQVSASAGAGATGVHWRAEPADQPSGSLPPGISVQPGAPVDIGAGSTVPISITLKAEPGAGATGTVILKLFAKESGKEPRARLKLDYQLHEARPGLVPEPAALEIGVQQGQSASGKITLTNKGYSAAQNVRLALLTREGKAPPGWIRLTSGAQIGALAPGQGSAIQIDASPDGKVPDGYHPLQLQVSADGAAAPVTVPVTVAVAKEGKGGARFKLVDIYTNTPDAQGRPIAGLQGARITLQHETLTGQMHTATTNAAGVAEFGQLTPGYWRWRASAANHMDASGRINVKAALTASERIFLDYQLVSVEFNVTETTVRDVYDIVLEATYRTEVPAPVVLMEPLSINLPQLQKGEEIIGEITLSNYGLVRADNLRFTWPASDEHYRYEFFGELPRQLAAKSRISIPYRITGIKPLSKGVRVNTQVISELIGRGLGRQPSVQVQQAIRQFLEQGQAQAVAGATPADTARQAAKAASCSSYQTQACAAYEFDCASGDTRKDGACTSFTRVSGTSCGAGSGGASGGNIWGGYPSGGGRGGGGGGHTGATTPLVPFCMPSCPDCSAGTGPAGQ